MYLLGGRVTLHIKRRALGVSDCGVGLRMPLSPKVRENSSIIYQQIDFDTSDEGVEVLMMDQARN